ncbi:MAG: hypothetical protein RIR05_507 [Bacteroidota bacterium]
MMHRFKRIFLVLSMMLQSCETQLKYLPDTLIGSWKSERALVNVRDRDTLHSKFRFTSDSIYIQLDFKLPKTITGLIGLGSFKTETIFQNQGLPHRVSGISYIVSCGNVTKLFANDPLNAKFIELWLMPQTHPDTLHAELRCKQYWDAFPMGSFTFIKKSNYVH